MSEHDHDGGLQSSDSEDFVTMTIAGQLFGIPVLAIQDVLGPQQITKIPLAPREVAGALNLRGRIVTAIEVRSRLNLDPPEQGQESMSIVVDHDGELYSLIVDTVGEVLSLPNEAFEQNPPTLDAVWRDVSTGIYRLDGQLLVVFDVSRLLAISEKAAA